MKSATVKNHGAMSSTIPSGRISLSTVSAYSFLVVVTFAVAMAGNVPGVFRVGGISVVGMVTAVVAAGAMLLEGLRPIAGRQEGRLLWPLFAFWVYDLVSTLWSPLLISSIQDTVVWGGFLFLIPIAAQVGRSSGDIAKRLFTIFDIATWPLLAYGLFLVALQTTKVAAMSLLFLLLMCYHLVQWRAGSRWGLVAGILFFLINALTSARTPAAVGIGLFVFLEMMLGNRYLWLRMVVAGALFAGIGVALFIYYPPLRQSFLQGDGALKVGEVAINTAGRISMWQVTVESWMTSPWIGTGTDAPPDVLYSGGQHHPHNDYLRILHHLGIIGLVLWLLFYVRTGWHVWKSWTRNREQLSTSRDVQLLGTTLMAIVAVGVVMLTDNPIVYSFVMYPLAILIGASLGVLQSRD